MDGGGGGGGGVVAGRLRGGGGAVSRGPADKAHLAHPRRHESALFSFCRKLVYEVRINQPELLRARRRIRVFRFAAARVVACEKTHTVARGEFTLSNLFRYNNVHARAVIIYLRISSAAINKLGRVITFFYLSLLSANRIHWLSESPKSDTRENTFLSYGKPRVFPVFLRPLS